MMKRIFLFLSLLPLFAQAQVLNIESMRFYNDSDGWIGRIDLSGGAMENVNRIYTLDNDVHVQYRHARHRLIFLNDLNFTKANNSDFENNGFQHVRYNYHLGDSSRWTAEAFVQSQYNKPMKIDLRAVAGTGIRYTLFHRPTFHCYIATLYMFEHEIDDHAKNIYNDHRISSYLTFSFNLGKMVEMNSTLYYQPNIIRFSDLRISESFNCIIDITRHFALGANFEFLYDTKQPEGVPNRTWNFEQQLSYRF